MGISNRKLDELASAWIKFHQAQETPQDSGQLAWAFDRLDDLVRDEPESAWRVIEHIRRLKPDDLILANLASGPLEDFIMRHGDEFIDRIESAARSDPQLKKLLGAVWRNDISSQVWGRIGKISSSSW